VTFIFQEGEAFLTKHGLFGKPALGTETNIQRMNLLAPLFLQQVGLSKLVYLCFGIIKTQHPCHANYLKLLD